MSYFSEAELLVDGGCLNGLFQVVVKTKWEVAAGSYTVYAAMVENPIDLMVRLDRRFI